MTRRIGGSSHNTAAAPAAVMVRTQDSTMPAYASSSQGPDGRMASAVQQKYAAIRVSR
ncbi:hypothetical protein [Streptomyces sp. NPDC047000]|uniref:hypothetical protein n=1 Tax=Streptomyces sp. NPDC047000 TaxID=3155474 RepID=UPI0033E9BFDA